MPLPDYWEVRNPSKSSEPYTLVKVSKQDVSPHVNAIVIESDPINLVDD